MVLKVLGICEQATHKLKPNLINEQA